MTPLGCAILELTVWWASHDPRPGEDAIVEMTARICWNWMGWLRTGEPGELAAWASELAWRARSAR